MVYTKKDLPANKSKHAYGLYFVTLIFKTEVLLNFLLTNSIIIIIFWSLHIISLFYIYVIYSRLAIDDPINTVFSVLKEREQDLLDEIQRRNELEDKLAETMEKIFNQNEEFQEILDNTGLLIFIKDLAGKYVRANRAFEDLIKLPREQIIGKTDFDLFNAKDAEIFHANDQEILATKLTLKMLETLTIDGFTKTFVSVKFPLGAKNRIYGICGIATDITDRLRTEEELWKAQKLESLGFLASGIAHDFNNYLMGAQSFLSFIEMEPDNPDEVKQNVETIKIALNKATVLTRQLITFAKGGNPIKKTINIKDLIMENAMFVMHGQKVKLQYENIIDCTLEIDPNQISQVLQNILLNAIQAIEKDYGIITINMKIEKNDETNEKLNSILPKGEYLKIQIKDNGMGIQPDHLKKVFDPYFTTKKNGTGLGLAISYSIVKRHGGHILIDSEINKGTIVSIFLPIYEVEQNIPTQQSTKQNLKFTGKVLIMEDDEMIANGLSRLLEKIGLEPEITNNGSDAIERFGIAKEMGQPFDFVILDLTVPGGMGGKECMEYLLKIDPNTIGIVSSGYSNDPILANPKDYGFFGILEKPYTYNDLYEQVKRIMEIREKNERSKA
jgi:PAS domain S-box-containing protein